jgi:hypothetical protein
MSGTRRRAAIDAGTATRRFTYKDQRHERACVKTPPSSRPSDAPLPAIAVKMPKAFQLAPE